MEDIPETAYPDITVGVPQGREFIWGLWLEVERRIQGQNAYWWDSKMGC
jgi:hypothetical protein